MEMRPKIRYWLPAAAVDEADLREEIRQLKARGFGGVEVVVLASVPEEIARGEDGWGHEYWNQTVAVIADETEKQQMSMDLAIGPGWPIVSPLITDTDDEAAAVELTYGETVVPAGTYVERRLPERRVTHPEGNVKLVTVMAYEEHGEKCLDADSYLDLTPYVEMTEETEMLRYDFPENETGFWKVFVFYEQPTVQKINAGQHYVVDHLSKKGVEACEKYWEQIWKENPYPSQESIFCDSLEYRTAFDWSHGFAEEFAMRRGYSILPYLPVVGLSNLFPTGDIPGYRFTDRMLSDQINQDYLEVQTQLYCENHLDELEKMAVRHGKTVRYQVAYNKPLEVERSALHVSIPENEALGRPALDGLKTMAAAAHLGRKGRYSFECAAEFGNAYGQSYEDLLWWVKRSLMAGMNAQVLHGGSYSGKYEGKYAVNGQIPGVRWPGYDGFYRAISNDWNRTPSVEDARGCLDAVARLNAVFRKNAKVDCAILKNTYCNDGLGSEFHHYPDDGKLLNCGYSYEFLSDAMLELPVCKVTNGKLDEAGPAYKCLIIDGETYLSTAFLERIYILAADGLPIIWIGERPVGSRYHSESNAEEKMDAWKRALDRGWNAPGVTHLESREEVPKMLQYLGVLPEVMLDGTKDVMTAVHEDETTRYVALYAYNRVEYAPDEPNPDEFGVSSIFRKGTMKSTYQRPGKQSRKTIRIKLHDEEDGEIRLCNPWSGKMEVISGSAMMVENADIAEDKGTAQQYREMTVEIEEDELILLAIEKKEKNRTDNYNTEVTEKCEADQDCGCDVKGIGMRETVGEIIFETLDLEEFGPNEDVECSFLRSGFRKYGETLAIDLPDQLKPWRKIDAALRTFSGRGTYRGTIRLEKKEPGKRYILNLGNVCDTFRVQINGIETDFPDQVMKEADVTEFIQAGENTLEVIVTSNLYNKLFEEPIVWKGMCLPYTPKDYGIWETKEKPICLYMESAGLY